MKDRVQAAMSKVWSDLNPKEPSPFYLAKLMAAMVGSFAVGLLIHMAQSGG